MLRAMICEVKVSSINYLQKQGVIDDIRTILDRTKFDVANSQLTQLAVAKYGLDTGGTNLFDVNISETTNWGQSRYWRNAQRTIYRAVPNDALFDELQKLKNQMDNRPDAMFMRSGNVSSLSAKPIQIKGSIYELEPNISDVKIKNIYDNYAALMNKVRESKAISYDTFLSLMTTLQVFNYGDTYIFGNWDAENAVFITRLNSSPTSKELLAEAIPAIVAEGVDVISFVPIDYANKLKRSGYVVSKNGYNYDFKGEDMVKYAAASNPNVFKKVFKSSPEKISSEEIENYNESLKLRYSPVDVRSDLINEAGKDASKIFETYLNQFGIKVKDISEIQEKLGVDALGFADILSKIAYTKSNKDLPNVAGEFIAYMMQYNSLVKDIIDETIQKEIIPLNANEYQIKDGKITYEYKKIDKTRHFKFIGDLIAQDLQNKLEGKYDKSLLSKIKQLVAKFFNLLKNVNVGLINTNIGVISYNILQQNKNLITSSLYKPGAYGKKTEQVSIEKALEKDKFGKDIVYRLSNKGFILTGSTALSEQGTVLRPDENPLHDIDWVSPFNRQETIEKFKSVYPGAIKVRDIVNDDYVTDSYLIVPDGYTIDNFQTETYNEKIILTEYDVLDKDGNVVGTFRLEQDPDSEQILEVTRGVPGKVIDFFSYSDYSRSNEELPFTYKTKDGQLINLANWKSTFKAKLEFARYKDLWDYNRFIPFSETKKGVQQKADPFVKVQGIPMVDVDITTIQNSRSKEIAEVLAQKLSLSMNVEFQNITEAEARDMLKARKIPYNSEPAFYFAGRVYVIGDNVTLDTVLHEFSHPLLQGIRQSNKKLFDNLYTLLSATSEGEQIINVIKERYPELEVGSDLFKEEALAWGLQKNAINKITQRVETEGFDNFIKKMMAAIKQFLRGVFGEKVNVAKLDVNTTLDELADMLLDKEFQFETPNVTEADLIMYGKFVVERANELTKIGEAGKLEQVIKEVYARNKDLLNNARNFKSDKVISNMVKESLFRKGTTEFLPGIQDSLRGYMDDINAPNVDEIIDNALNAEEKRLEDQTNKAVALVNTMDTVNNTITNILSDLRKIENLPNINARNVIALLGLYKNTANAWMETIKDIDDILSKEIDVDTSNPFYQTLNEIINNISRIQRRIGNIYQKNNVQFMVEITGYMNDFVTQRLNENLGVALKNAFSADELENAVLDVYNKVIEQKFTDQDAEELVKKGVPAEVLNRFLKEYNDFIVNEDKIKDALTGHAKDVSFFNRWLESYSSSNDVIVGPLAMFIQDQRTEVEQEVLNESMEFRKKLEILLPRINFSKLNTTQVRDLVSGKDTIMYFDSETGKPIEKEVYTFLNEFGNGWRYQQDILEYNLEQAKETKDQDKIAQAQEELRQFNREYMWQEFVPEFYEKDDIFNQSEIGGLAYLARKQALNNFNNLVNQFDNELSRFENYAPVQAAWREYQQLYSLYYEDGTPKTDDPLKGVYDLSIAQLLIEHKSNTRDYYEFMPIEGSLQTSYNEFVSLLEGQGTTKGSAEFKKKVKEWEKQNLRMVYTDEYYTERTRILTRIQELQGKMNAVMNSEFNVGDAYKKISDLIFSYRDEQGQPMSSELGEDKLKMIRDTQQAILDFRFRFDLKSGLSKEQSAELDELKKVIKQKPDEITEEQEKRYVYLIKLQSNAGIDPQDAIDIQEAFAELSDIQARIPTDDYMEALNYNLSKQNVKEVNEDQIDDLINSDEFAELLKNDKNFQKWFELNHIVKQVYNSKTRNYESKFDKTLANSVAVPRNTKFLKTTSIIDTETNEEIKFIGVPNSRHSRYQVKNEYRTVPFGEDKSQYVGKFIDNKGNYLPRQYNPGTRYSAKDDRFINKEYLQLKAQNSARFQLLEAMKEYHLSVQEGQTNYGKLYLDVPRYAIKRMDIYQVLQKGKYGERFKELTSNTKEWLKQTFGRSTADFENDLNYDPKNNLVNTDLEGNKISYIPVTGIYNLDLDITDADVIQGMFKYAMSLQSQGKLLESLPLVEGLLTTLEDPANKPKDLENYQKSAFNVRNMLQNSNKEGATNNRLGQVRSLIEREYYGKQVIGMEENHPVLSKWINALQGLSARGSLAVNISSDLKNKYSGYMQTLIEAAGGEFITMKDLALATPWATKAMLEWTSKDIYAVGPGSLTSQMVQIFDPAFKTKNEFGRSVTRSIFKDLVNGEWMYMHRKFGEMEVAMKLFGSFLYGQKIDQVLKDGTVKSIRYVDAWEKDANGIIKLKDGIHPGWNNRSVFHTYVDGETLKEIADRYYMDVEELKAKNKIKSETQLEDGQEIIIAKSEKFKGFKNRLQGVSRRLFGVYDDFGQPEGNKLLLYRMFFFMRKWFTPMLVNRFGMDTSKEGFGNARYDWALGKYTKGYYVSAFQTMWRMIKSKGQSYSYMTDQEKSDFRRFTSEGLALIMTALLASMLFGYDPDDEDRWKKLKAKSGPLFTPTYDTYGFLSNHILNLLLGVQAETGAFVPLPSIFGMNLGADDYVKMITSTSASFYNTLVLYVQMLGDIFNFITFDEAARYKKDVGPYWYQQEGELKIWKRLFKTIGFTGGTGDPESLVKNLEQSSSRIGG
jgi:LysM repeat protein